MARKFSLLFALFCALAACALGPDDTVVVNKETIEDFFERGPLKSWDPPSRLNLDINQPVADAEIPPVPAGQARLSGTLDTAYGPLAGKGDSLFKNSVYGKVGPAGNGGNAWFYADINPATGQITGARAYLYGFNGGVCDLRESADGSFGEIAANGFTLSIDGYCAFPDSYGTMYAYALVISGEANPLAQPALASVPVRYIIDNTGKIAEIPADPAENNQILQYGAGSARRDQARLLFWPLSCYILAQAKQARLEHGNDNNVRRQGHAPARGNGCKAKANG